MAKRSFSDVMSSRSKYGRKVRAKVSKRVPMSALPRSVVPETKWRDLALAPAVASFTSLQLQTAQGDQRDQRSGSKIYVKSIDFSLVLDPAYNGACRVTFAIPKNPSFGPIALTPSQRYSQDEYFILKDVLFSSKDYSTLRLNIPVNRTQQYVNTTLAPTFNNIFMLINLEAPANTSYSNRMYFTDA